ncbi:MAG: cytochrome c oxidase subunit 3 [bacterium]
MEPGRPARQPLTAATMGMYLGLVSGTMGFLAVIVCYLLIRNMHASDWLPPQGAPFPATLYMSTLVILVSSGTMQYALNSIRHASVHNLRNGLLGTLVLSLTFYVLQWSSYRVIVASPEYEAANYLFSGTFFMMSALHAAHLLGGVIPLIVLYRAAGRDCYSEESHQAVTSTNIYWHFLTVMWCALFAVMLSAKFIG